MTMMLDLLRDAFEFARIPNSFYEAMKTIKNLPLDYIKIDACPNDCMLYWGDDAEEETCKHCHISRWKPNKKSNRLTRYHFFGNVEERNPPINLKVIVEF
ncbi:hypothetical protein RND71_019278 [Anisodus tanguticus]|uniref:Uncharacterized protein n=1 Tax=Anisodus tanguticus TaxID=243964 RepID=A0AAE1VE64_9SOLA|nr:hypothetical protein RND71_019278 [Anisodus tanguticus]